MKIPIFITVVILIIITGCGDNNEITEDDYVAVYGLALTAVMNKDVGLNDRMAYIAVDSQGLENVSDAGIEKVLEGLVSFHEMVLDESFVSLKEKGMFIDDDYFEGVLLEVKSIDVIRANEMEVVVSKSKSGNGAVVMTCVIVRKGDLWSIKEIKDVTMA